MKKCKTCEKIFQPKRDGQETCSRSCNMIYRNKSKIFTCPRCLVCKKETRRESRAKYCSSECQGIGSRGKNHVFWKGGIKKHSEGYVYVYKPKHPNCDEKNKYVLEHRLVMEKSIKRFLKPTEVVHHINGDKSDNRLSNLVLITNQKKHLEEHNYFCDGKKRRRQSS